MTQRPMNFTDVEAELIADFGLEELLTEDRPSRTHVEDWEAAIAWEELVESYDS